MDRLRKILDKIRRKKKGIRRKGFRVHPDSPRPDRDWIIILVVFAALVVFAGGYSYNLFFTVVHGDLANHEEGKDLVQTIDKAKLLETVTVYIEKRDEYVRLGGIALPVVRKETVISEEIAPLDTEE